MAAPDPLLAKALAQALSLRGKVLRDLTAALAPLRGAGVNAAHLAHEARLVLARFVPELASLMADSTLAAWLAGAAKLARRAVPARGPVAPDASWTSDWRGTTYWRPVVEGALAELRRRGLLSRPLFDGLQQSARRSASQAANVTADLVLQELALDAAESGADYRTYREQVEARLAGTPLAPHRVENAFRTNVASALAAGQDAVMADPVVRSAFPYMEQIGVPDSRQTEACRLAGVSGLDGTAIYNALDPWWQRIRPPRHFNCRCFGKPTSVRDAAAKGVREAQEWLRTGRPPAQFQFVPPPPVELPPGWQPPVSLSLADPLALLLGGVPSCYRLAWRQDPDYHGPPPNRKWVEDDPAEPPRYQEKEPGKRGPKPAAAASAPKPKSRPVEDPSTPKPRASAPVARPAAPPAARTPPQASGREPAAAKTRAAKPAAAPPPPPPKTMRPPPQKTLRPPPKPASRTAQGLPKPEAVVRPRIKAVPPLIPARPQVPLTPVPQKGRQDVASAAKKAIVPKPVEPAKQAKKVVAKAGAPAKVAKPARPPHPAAAKAQKAIVPKPAAPAKPPQKPATKPAPAPKAAGREAQKLAATLESHLERAGGLAAGQKALYKMSLGRATARMPDRVAKAVGANVGKALFFANSAALTAAVRKAAARKGGAAVRDGADLYGMYAPGSGQLLLDGAAEDGTSHTTKTVHGIYAHELTHALDRSAGYSKTEDWGACFEEIRATRAVSRYATKSADEAFAEVGRLVYGSGVGQDVLAQRLPKTFAFWKKHGLLE